MSLKNLMQYRKAKSEFFKANKWMEENFSSLSDDAKNMADKRFHNVSQSYDDEWNNLSIKEKSNEITHKKMEETGWLFMVEEKKGERDRIPF